MMERHAGQHGRGVGHVPMMQVYFTWVLSSGSFEGGLGVGRSESWFGLDMLGDLSNMAIIILLSEGICATVHEWIVTYMFGEWLFLLSYGNDWDVFLQ